MAKKSYLGPTISPEVMANRKPEGRKTPRPVQTGPVQKSLDYTKILWVISLCIVVLTFLYVRYTQLSLPLDRDEGSLLYSGYSLLHGKIPYVDFYEIKPPGIFAVYALFHLLFGYGNEMLHIGLIVTQLGIALLFFKAAERMYHSRNAAYMAAVTFLLLCLNPYFLSFAVMSEYFFILFFLGAVLPLLKNPEEISDRDYVISGLCFGMTAMIRQHAIFFALPYLLFVLQSLDWNIKKLMKPGFRILAGAAAVVLPLILYVTVRGALDDMIYWIWERPNSSFIKQISFSEGRVHLKAFLNLLKNVYTEWMWVFFAGLALVAVRLPAMRYRYVALPVLLVLSVAAVFPGNRFYGHYWILTFPAVVMITAASVLWLEKITDNVIRNAALVVVPILMILHMYRNREAFFPVQQDGLYRFIYGDNPNYTLHKLTGYLKNRIKKGEEVFVFGSEPQVYYECRAIPSTRHSYIATVHVPGSTNVPYQQEVMDYLQSRKPEYIMHVQYAHSVYMTEESSRNLYNWIFSFEQNHYDVIALAEEGDDRQIRYLYENDAAAYKPSGSKYIILYRRRAG
ncbi:MAG: glycosyltransferase family 39 protein [Saprospiraceae bacterium]|nr:glycosyltransferase family 39 protein [Saprospiraceae bacterium]